MSKIPDPPQEKSTGEDNATKFLKEWKRLFNKIDPKRISAYIKTDKSFRDIESDFFYHAIRLDGECNTDVQLVVYFKGHFRHLSYSGGNIFCCLQNQAYSSSWIRELDENLDVLSQKPVSWVDIYNTLISETVAFKNRIPTLPL